MAYGLLSTGFAAKTLEVVRADISDKISNRISASLNLTDKSSIGKLIGIISEALTELWELAEASYGLWDPDSASGDGLRKLSAITGTLALDATRSTVVLTLCGISGSATPLIGTRVAVTSTSLEFETTTESPSTFTAVSAWATATALVAGDRRRTNVGGVDRIYQCVSAGTTHASTPPSDETASVTDGTATLTYLGRGTGAVDFNAQAVATGPIVAVARDITTIRTPVLDWNTVINIDAATPGVSRETDEELRVRREEEINRLGSSPIDAIRSDILDVAGVTSCVVFQNLTDTTDGDGVPPHSVEVLVQGGDDQDIFDALLDAVAAGIRTHGTETGSAVDDSGNSHVVKFSRPVEVNIYVDIVLKYTADYPTNGDALVKDLIVAEGNALDVGRNIVSTHVASWVYGQTGVDEVDPPEIDDAAAPGTTATVVITNRQIARFATGRITVTSTPLGGS